MPLKNSLELKLSQKLILTPQLQLAIKLLQMPQLELSEALAAELTENPFLEETAEFKEDPSGAEADNSEITDSNDDTEAPLEKFISNLSGISVDNYFDERASDGRDLGYFTPGTVEYQVYEGNDNTELDLYGHLQWQLRLSGSTEDIRQIGEIVIGNIDENGYLRATDEDIAAAADADIETVRQAIELVQGFDPCGVAARDLRECLLLQLKSLNLSGSFVENIILNNMADLEKKRYQQIARQYNTAINEVMAAVSIIHGLEPKPARNFSNAATSYVVPDVFVVKTGEDYQILLNDEQMPRLRLNSQYRKLLSKNLLSTEEKKFLDEKLRSAIWLLKSLDLRNKTIYRTTESIIALQRDFFDKGISYMKPLNLKDIAIELGLHESTISRATSNKYLSCSHGMFSFRIFFSSSLHSGNGSVSSTSVKDLIKTLVAEEDTTNPLSDQKVAEILKAKDITIARRTVAKYRDECNIPPQGRRKRITS